MTSFYRAINSDPFEAFPSTFHINSVNDTEFTKFKFFFEGIQNDIKDTIKWIQEDKRPKVESRKVGHWNTRPKKRIAAACFSDTEDDDDSDEYEYDDDEEDSVEDDDRIPRNIWIVKPGENSNSGNGINVCSTINEIKNLILSTSSNKKNTYII